MTSAGMAGLSSLTGSSVELLVSCTGLADLDEFTKSDPICVLFFKQFGQWKEFSRTEAITNSLNPKFTETFVMDFEPAIQQVLMFSVYDIDNSSTNLKHHDFVGSVEVTLESLLDPSKTITTTCKTLRVPGDSRARGIISITAEIIRPSKNKVTFHVGGQKLTKTGKIIMTKPDTYLEISRSIDTVYHHPVFRTEIIYKSQHPRWRPFDVPVQKICNGDWDRHIYFSCWHFSGTGDYKLIGRKVTTLRELTILKQKGHYLDMDLIPKKETNKKQGVKMKYCGTLRFFQIDVDWQYSLLDFIRGGLQIKLKIGIDFTSSNGALSDDLCLHKTTPTRRNPYVDVIQTLGMLLAQYDQEEKIALFGFGAKLPGTNKTSHCFPVTNNWDNVYVNSITEAIETYQSRSKGLKFSGPTRLQPVLAMAEAMAVREPSQEDQVYHVMMVITDGVINDLDDTIHRLISISHLPLTVIFVGVGPADFSNMDTFSFHNERLLSHTDANAVASRLNTHFISFSRSESPLSDGNELASRDALAILSTQILSYMKKRNIIPNPASPVRQSSGIKGDAEMILVEEHENTAQTMTRVSSNLSEKSTRFTDTTGPTCPTCGSVVEAGTFLYTDISNFS